MAYFNELAGGPERGWWHLTDSNVDWGQGLLDVRDWAVAHPEARPLGLVYGNFVNYRVPGLDLPDVDIVMATKDRPVYLAVSVCDLVLPYRVLQRYTPIACIGYVTLVYRLTPTEAAGVLWARGQEQIP